MKQRIEDRVLKEFERVKNLPGTTAPGTITNSVKPKTSWMRKVTDNLRISDLGRDYLVNGVCPRCNEYKINFDDGRGWFCCQKPKCFSGNIVDFMEFFV